MQKIKRALQELTENFEQMISNFEGYSIYINRVFREKS